MSTLRPVAAEAALGDPRRCGINLKPGVIPTELRRVLTIVEDRP